MQNTMILAQWVPQIFCSQGNLTIQNKTEKGDNSVKYLQNFAKINQVIYTLDTICMPNIMTLAQAVLQIFSQDPLWVKCLSPKRGIIQSNFDRILRKVNQVITIMYPNCMTDIMILAQVVPQIFVHKVAFSHKTTKTEKGDNSVKYLENFAKR